MAWPEWINQLASLAQYWWLLQCAFQQEMIKWLNFSTLPKVMSHPFDLPLLSFLQHCTWCDQLYILALQKGRAGRSNGRGEPLHALIIGWLERLWRFDVWQLKPHAVSTDPRVDWAKSSSVGDHLLNSGQFTLVKLFVLPKSSDKCLAKDCTAELTCSSRLQS